MCCTLKGHPKPQKQIADDLITISEKNQLRPLRLPPIGSNALTAASVTR